jgi:outer membrane receptor for ferrienterochelin and colicins
VTTASKFAEDLADAPGVMTVVTRDEIRRFGAITLGEVLDRVPGLTGTSAYFTDRSLVAARGDQTRIDGGHVLILINGRPSREVLEGGIVSDLLESFPVGVLERIEVIRGPGSVLYGSNAFSAVINLITQEAKKNGIAVSGLPGANGARAGAAQVSLKFRDLGIVGAAQFHQAPEWSVPFRYWDPMTGVVSIQNAALQDRGSGGYLGISYKGLSFMSSVTGWNGTGFVGGFVGQPRWRRGFADLGYRFQVRRGWDMTFNVTYIRTTYSITSPPNIDRDSYEVLGEWSNFVTLGERDQITFGALVNHIQGSELYTGVQPSQVVSSGGWPGGAVYAQWEHKLLDRVKLLGDADIELPDQSGSELPGRERRNRESVRRVSRAARSALRRRGKPEPGGLPSADRACPVRSVPAAGPGRAPRGGVVRACGEPGEPATLATGLG